MKLRPEVLRFAQLMEAKLRENDHKGGWGNETTGYLLRRLRSETDELANAIKRAQRVFSAAAVPLVSMEAADVANFAMMLADVAGDDSRALMELAADPEPRP